MSRLVAVGGGRSLLLSTESGANGHELRAQVIANWGEPVGSSLRVSAPEVNVIRPANAVLEASGETMVVYLASRSEEVDVLGTLIACSD
jgi:hypothetical protein